MQQHIKNIEKLATRFAKFDLKELRNAKKHNKNIAHIDEATFFQERYNKYYNEYISFTACDIDHQ